MRIVDAGELPAHKQYTADVCIVGAGAMGITLAREFIGKQYSVLLIESGGETTDDKLQELYMLESVGLPLANKSHISRTRAFGGSTNCWGGWCRPYNKSVLDQWPIGSAALDPYWERANQTLFLKKCDFDNPQPWVSGTYDKPLSYGPGLKLGIRQVRPFRLWREYKDELIAAPNIQILGNLNLVGITVAKDSERVSSAKAITLEGTEVILRAKYFVLAAGGIENALLLLNFNTQYNNRIGNAHDNVGRYFADNVEIIDGKLLEWKCLTPHFQNPNEPMRPKLSRLQIMQHYTLDPKIPEYSDLPSHALGIWNHDDECKNSDWDQFLQAPKKVTSTSDPLMVYLQFAPTPVRDSRLTLSDKKNRLGLFAGKLDWRVAEQDRYSVLRILRGFERHFGANGLGRIKASKVVEEKGWGSSLGGGEVFNGRHYMGTTRMAKDPRDGVVDTDLKVFGTDNLYVAGPCAYPAHDWSGPTYTGMALTYRLFDHLTQRLVSA